MNSHEQLIAQLANGLAPVKPWRPVWQRALLWLALALPAGALLVLAVFGSHLQLRAGEALSFWLSVGVPLLLALPTMAAAYATQVPGRRVPVGMLMLSGLFGWGVLTWFQYPSAHADPGRWGAGLYCLLFMLLAGLPMVAGFAWLLRRRPLLAEARRGLPLVGLAAFYSASALLSLCHPPHASLMDLGGHLLAGAGLVLLAWLCGRRAHI